MADDVFRQLLILMVVVWAAAVAMRKLGWPTVMGELVQKVTDRLDGIAYTLLGPIFFISLGFHVTFDALKGDTLWFVLALTAGVYVIQIISAGGMARRLKFSWPESATVGVGMCGRAEMSFVLASLGLSMNVLGDNAFSALIFTAFLLNILTPIGLLVCSKYLKLGPPLISCVEADEESAKGASSGDGDVGGDMAASEGEASVS